MPDSPTELAQNTRLAMRRLAASVALVTTRDGAARAAMAVSAVTSLSMEPPSLLICVNRKASIYPPLAASGDFCVNLLSDTHQDLSVACSVGRHGEARFEVGDWQDDPDTGIPFLADAQACLICAVDDIHHYGTHGIFIGKVKHVRLHGGINPLIYIDGHYGAVAKPSEG